MERTKPVKKQVRTYLPGIFSNEVHYISQSTLDRLAEKERLKRQWRREVRERNKRRKMNPNIYPDLFQ